MSARKMQPPGYLWIHIALMVGLHFVVPVVQLIGSPYRYLGIVLIAAGLWLNIWADGLFKKKKTTVKPFEKSSAIILEGPFRFTRNPMYLGMVIALIGVAILLGSLIAFAGPIAFYFSMTIAFIRHEEKAMEDVFGEEYLEYRKRVRRWI